jgi:hypothetical protein
MDGCGSCSPRFSPEGYSGGPRTVAGVAVGAGPGVVPAVGGGVEALDQPVANEGEGLHGALSGEFLRVLKRDAERGSSENPTDPEPARYPTVTLPHIPEHTPFTSVEWPVIRQRYL